MKYPPELDALMWEVAEADSTELMDEFGGRYPEHKAELVRRIQMVRQLKGSRPKSATQKTFVPPAAAPKPKPTAGLNWSFVGAGAILLAVGALAGVGISALVQKPAPITINTPAAQPEPQRPTEEENRRLEEQTWINPSGETTAPVQNPPQTAPAPINPVDRLVTVRATNMSLDLVLEAIASQAGVALQAAPGMPDLAIDADYSNLPAIAVLNDLGRNFGFTPMIQSDREVLLIPAVDQQNPPPQAGSGMSGSGSGAAGGGVPSVSPPGQLPPAGLNGPIGGR